MPIPDPPASGCRKGMVNMWFHYLVFLSGLADESEAYSRLSGLWDETLPLEEIRDVTLGYFVNNGDRVCAMCW